MRVKLFIALAFYITTAVGQSSISDSRDKNIYSTIKIGDQIWMSQNINYASDKAGICYDNNAENRKTFGRLYNWESAKNMCPAGWHLPSKSEVETLIDNFNGNTDAYTNLIKGGASGFNSLLSGWHDPEGDFIGLGLNTYFWTSDACGENKAWSLALTGKKEAYMSCSFSGFGYAVRCIKN